MANHKSIKDINGNYVKLIKEKPQFDTPPEGEPTGHCSVCGAEFAQFLIDDKNRYTSFGLCPKHRRNKDFEMEEVITVQIDYTPHPAQQLFHDSKARFRVLCCGARFGKDRASTMEGIKYFLECLNEDRDSSMVPSVYWWIIAPTEKMAKQNWKELCRYFPKDLVEYVSNSDMMLQTKYGGLIEIRSAYDPESLVGVGLDIVTITEGARVADLETVWSNVEARLNSPGRGLGGKGGIGIINSSPKGRNYFYRMWRWGNKDGPDYDPDWESWRFETWDNPAMAVKGEELKLLRGKQVTYKELLKKRMGVNRYNQDYLALFIAGETKCFPGFYDNCVTHIPTEWTQEQKAAFIRDWQEPKPYETYVIGYDPASVGDMPAVVVIEESTGRVKRAYDLSLVGTTEQKWNPQYDKLREISTHYNDAIVAFSQTGHMTIQEELEKRGLTCFTVNEQGSSKENFVSHLEGVVERGEIQALDDGSEIISTMIDQFNDYARIEKTTNGKTRVEFGNVDEPHDDLISACYVAYQAVKSPEEALPYFGTLGGVRI